MTNVLAADAMARPSEPLGVAVAPAPALRSAHWVRSIQVTSIKVIPLT